MPPCACRDRGMPPSRRMPIVAHHVAPSSAADADRAAALGLACPRAAPACRARSRSDPSPARRSCRRARPAARRSRRRSPPRRCGIRRPSTGSTSWPSAATTVIFRPGMRTSKKRHRRAVDEAQPHLLAGREQAGPVARRRRAVHQIGVGGAADVGEIGRVHAHRVPHAPVARAVAPRPARVDVAQEIADGAACRSCSSRSASSASA